MRRWDKGKSRQSMLVHGSRGKDNRILFASRTEYLDVSVATGQSASLRRRLSKQFQNCRWLIFFPLFPHFFIRLPTDSLAPKQLGQRPELGSLVNKTCTQKRSEILRIWKRHDWDRGHAAVNELAARSPQRSEAYTSVSGCAEALCSLREASLRSCGRELRKGRARRDQLTWVAPGPWLT